MKGNLSLFAIVFLTICLVGFAIGWITPTPAVHAANHTHPVMNISSPSEKEAMPHTLSAQPVAFVLIGLACVLLGMMAVSPLLIDDPVLRREAGISIERRSGEENSP